MIAIRRFIMTVFCLSIFFPVGASAELDDVYYSSAMCKPHISTMNGGAQTDLRFQSTDGVADSGPIRGGWMNLDKSNAETLVCPVPFDKDNNKHFVVARVVIHDRNRNETVAVDLCGQSAQGPTKCPFPDGNGGTGESFTGVKTVQVRLQRTVTGSGTADQVRWVWLRIRVPDIDQGASKVLGYRVVRCRRDSTQSNLMEPGCPA